MRRWERRVATSSTVKKTTSHLFYKMWKSKSVSVCCNILDRGYIISFACGAVPFVKLFAVSVFVILVYRSVCCIMGSFQNSYFHFNIVFYSYCHCRYLLSRSFVKIVLLPYFSELEPSDLQLIINESTKQYKCLRPYIHIYIHMCRVW
jgi:hypothetical protein